MSARSFIVSAIAGFVGIMNRARRGVRASEHGVRIGVAASGVMGVEYRL